MAEENKEIPKIRTFKTDAEIYMRENKVSQAEIASKSYVAQSKIRFTQNFASFNYKKYIYIAGGILILGATAYAVYQYYPQGAENRTPTANEPKGPAKFLEAESETVLNYTPGTSLTEELKKTLTPQFRMGSANFLKIKSGSGYPDAKSFVSAMNWKPPQTFLNNLEADYNVLVFYQSPANAPIFIFKVKNFSTSYAAALDWEAGEGGSNPLWQDLKPFIDLNGIDPASLYKRVFEDDLIKNNDARALKSKDGSKLLLEYSFFNKKYLIISPSRQALDLVLTRFLALPPQ